MNFGKGVTGKIWLSIGVFALGYLVSMVLGQVQNGLMEGRLSAAADALFPAAQQAQSGEDRFAKMTKRQQDAVMTEDTGALDQARTEGQKLVEDIRAMAALPGLSAERKADAAEVARQADAFVSDADRSYRAVAGAHGNLTPGMQSDLKRLATASDQLRERLSQLGRQTAEDLKLELKGTAESSARQRWIALGVFVLTLLVAGALVKVTIDKAITRPLAELTEALAQSTEQIGGASRRLSNSSRTLSSNSSSQAAALEQTSATSEQVSAMARRNAEGAQQAREKMMQAGENFREMDSSQRQLEAAMAAISDSSQQISRVIKVIEEIAFQTNILALNASVEAARAGVHGMGFAVVADEVRNLAHRCAESAHETKKMVEDSVDKAELGNEKLKVVTNYLVKTRSLNVEVDQLIDLISKASAEQVSGVEQISRTVVHTSHGTQTTAAQAEENAQTVNELEAQAERLVAVTERLTEMIDG